MAHKTQHRAPHRRQAGLSLVEILVGVLIGMIGIIVIFQVLAVSEQQKRNTTGGAEAQGAGALSLFSMQQDLQLAGYGLSATGPDPIACEVKASRAGVPFSLFLVPVEIVQPGAAGLDGKVNNHPTAVEVRVLYGNSPYFVSLRSFTNSTATSKTMDSGGRGGFNVGDLVVFTGTGAAPPCMLAQITCRPGDPLLPTCAGTDKLVVDHDPATVATYPYNDAVVLGAFAPTSGFAFNLGPAPRYNVWRVTTAADALGPNKLVVTDSAFGGGVPVEIAAGVIDLQAEYGVDANGNNQIEDNEWSVTPPVGAAWLNVRAVRIAVLSRSENWDKSASAADPSSCSPNPQWTSGRSGALAPRNFGAPGNPPAMLNLDGAAGSADCSEATPDPMNWRRYRYRVYETVVPLRNMIWGTTP